MSQQHTHLVLFLSLVMLSLGVAFAQTPAAPPQLDVATTRDSQDMVGTAVDGLGNVTLLWFQLFTDGTGLEDYARGRRFSASDTPLGVDLQFDGKDSAPVAVVANRRGDTLAAWNRILPSRATQGVVRRIGTSKLTLRLSHPIEDVAVDEKGNFVVVWSVLSASGSHEQIFGQRFNANGSKRGPAFNPATTVTGSQFGPRVAMNPHTGEFVVTWQSGDEHRDNRRILAQRFGFATGRQGSEFRVSDQVFDSGQSVVQDVGRAEDGSFVVGWSHIRRFAEGFTHIFAQRFDDAGNKAGDEILVADAQITDGYMRLAVAPQGQFVVAWDDGGPPLFVALHRRDGTPAGPPRQIVKSVFPGLPEPAFGWNGTFVIGWTDFIGIHEPNDDTWEANYQRFAASPGVELCVFRTGHFRCDTGRTGGKPEVDHLFDVTDGTPVLGDLDGDGRADYCLFRAGGFVCDSGHDYGAAELVSDFGEPGDTPLIGDVDGDGLDDPCVFRSGHFLCDTAHDGGAAELDLDFAQPAQPGDRALLGDVDGDGRADPCLAGNTEIRCDTAHDGGGAETVIAFSRPPGAVPVLGDVDGDGRADPCTFLNGTFRCDTAQAGPAGFVLVLDNQPGRPLIGNVDGL